MVPALRAAPAITTLRDEDGQVFAAIWTSGRKRLMHLPGVATFVCPLDGPKSTATPEPGVSPPAVVEAFHRFVVPVQLYFAGYEVLHASAVRTREGTVGFCAEAGTGKTTLAYGLSTRGSPLWADDALALDVSQRPHALLLPFNPRLRPRAMRFFEASSFRPPLRSPAEQESVPVAALAVVKRVTGGTNAVRIERLSGGSAFHDLVRHAYRVDLKADYARRKTLIENYMKIVASVPVFEISFRPGFQRFPSVLDRVAEFLDAELGQAA